MRPTHDSGLKACLRYNRAMLNLSSRRPLLVAVIAYDGITPFHLSVPCLVFGAQVGEPDAPLFAVKVCAADLAPLPTAAGFAIVPEHDLSLLETADIVIMPSWHDDCRAAPASLVTALQGAHRRGARMVGLCLGAFPLAQAGLLDGKRAATHWLMYDQLGETHPLVDVDRQAIFVQHGDIWTSGGVTAGIDLALAMVEEDCGREVALAVARELVVFVKRPSGQPQLSWMLQAQAGDGPLFDELHMWILANLERTDLSVDVLAARMRMSPRNFSRVYTAQTGQTPARAVERFRLEAACRLLEDSARHVDQVALLCGFGDEGRMRKTFQRHLHTSPTAYRHRLEPRSLRGRRFDMRLALRNQVAPGA